MASKANNERPKVNGAATNAAMASAAQIKPIQLSAVALVVDAASIASRIVIVQKRAGGNAVAEALGNGFVLQLLDLVMAEAGLFPDAGLDVPGDDLTDAVDHLEALCPLGAAALRAGQERSGGGSRTLLCVEWRLISQACVHIVITYTDCQQCVGGMQHRIKKPPVSRGLVPHRPGMGGGGWIYLPTRLDTVGSLAPLGYPDRLPAALIRRVCRLP